MNNKYTKIGKTSLEIMLPPTFDDHDEKIFEEEDDLVEVISNYESREYMTLITIWSYNSPSSNAQKNLDQAQKEKVIRTTEYETDFGQHKLTYHSREFMPGAISYDFNSHILTATDVLMIICHTKHNNIGTIEKMLVDSFKTIRTSK